MSRTRSAAAGLVLLGCTCAAMAADLPSPLRMTLTVEEPTDDGRPGIRISITIKNVSSEQVRVRSLNDKTVNEFVTLRVCDEFGGLTGYVRSGTPRHHATTPDFDLLRPDAELVYRTVLDPARLEPSPQEPARSADVEATPVQWRVVATIPLQDLLGDERPPLTLESNEIAILFAARP